MIHICIPSRDEARTLGVLLWRTREVMRELGRDFHVIVLDDGSRDHTRTLLKKYARVMPLTVIRERTPVGYAGALERLLEAAAARTRYPRRDAIVVMQADFTEHPDELAPLVRAFEGGADIVTAHTSSEGEAAPRAIRRARRWGRWALRASLGRGPGGAGDSGGDPLNGFRAYRAFVVKNALAEVRDGPFLASSGWAANAELLSRLAPHARRVASIPVRRRYDIRPRGTRVRALAAVRDIWRLRRVALPLALALCVQPAAFSGVLPAALPGIAPAFLAPAAAAAQSVTRPPAAQQTPELVRDSLSAASTEIARMPFAPGEEMRFRLRASFLGGGEATMSVLPVDTVNGFATLPVEWHIDGSVIGIGISDRFQSWMDVESLAARRFIKDQRLRGRQRYRAFDFLPEERRVQRLDHDTTWALPSPLPLDDISFVYFARTLDLEVGDTLTFNRFYKNEGNPVVLRVLRRDRTEVPAGVFNTIVVQPVIRTSGLFEGGDAEIHFSDDERRLVVYMRADMGAIYPTLEMSLESVKTADPG